MDYANTTNVEFIVDPKVLFHGWLIYSYLQIFKLIKCKWLPGECADWFFDNIMTWSYCLHRRYNMSRQKNRILINEHALNHETFPLMWRPGSVPYLPLSYFKCNRVCMGYGKPGKSWSLRISFSTPGMMVGHGKSWKFKSLFGRLVTAGVKVRTK